MLPAEFFLNARNKRHRAAAQFRICRVDLVDGSPRSAYSSSNRSRLVEDRREITEVRLDSTGVEFPGGLRDRLYGGRPGEIARNFER
jgi:hypothetical protein